MSIDEVQQQIATVRVLLADDHDILRQGLKLLLETQQDIKVVGEARTGREAIEFTSHLKPDVAIIDISMAEMDGFEACQHIRQRTSNHAGTYPNNA